jgi:hypothetical protein
MAGENNVKRESPYSSRTPAHGRTAKVRVGILLWALGVPLPIVLLVVLIRGC